MRPPLDESPVRENGSKYGEHDDRYNVRAVDRAARVLTVLAEAKGPQTLSAIAAGLSIATTLRLLRTLQGQDLVQSQGANGGYLLGFRVLQLSQALLRQLDIATIFRPFITAVPDECDETAGIVVRTGDYWIHLVEVEAAQSLRQVNDLGQRLPLYAGSSGKVFLAAMTDAEVEEYLAHTPIVRLSDTTPTDPQTLRQQIAQVRGQGYAESNNERGERGAAVAAPVRGHDGCVIAALKISGPSSRFTPERMACYIEAVHLASSVSRRLSATVEAPDRQTRGMAGTAFPPHHATIPLHTVAATRCSLITALATARQCVAVVS